MGLPALHMISQNTNNEKKGLALAQFMKTSAARVEKLAGDLSFG